MDKQERYYELDNIVSTLNVLINEIEDKYYKDVLNDIKEEVKEEMESLID